MTRPIALYSELKSVVARCPVFFLSDHGAMTGDHWMIRKGPFQFEGLFRVPIIWSYPKGIRRRRTRRDRLSPRRLPPDDARVL
jgi:hypothetical protein